MTGPEQHAATVRDGERIAAELYAAAEKGGVTWSQLACEQMSRTVRRLVALAGRADEPVTRRPRSNQSCRVCRAEPGIEHDPSCPWALLRAAEARADELERERDALREAAQISDTLELGWHKPYLQEMEKRQAAEARADELQRERDEWQATAEEVGDELRRSNALREQARREADQLREKLDRLANFESTWELLQQNDRLRAALEEIEDGTTPDRIGRYNLLRDWVNKTARAALAGVQAHGYGPDAGISFPDDGGTITVEPDPTLRAYSRDRGGVQADNKDSA